MGLEQLLGDMRQRVNEYTDSVKKNWKEYSLGIKSNLSQTLSDIRFSLKLMPDLAELRNAAHQDIKDGHLEDFVYAGEGIKFIFHPQEILPFNVEHSKVTYTLLGDVVLEKGKKKFKTAKPIEVFFYNGRTVYEGTVVREMGFFPIGKEYEAMRMAAAKALEKMRNEYCSKLSDYLTERWRQL